MWPLAVLTRDSINVFFFYKEMYGRFAGPKKVAVKTRWLYYRGGCKAGFHCSGKRYLHHMTSQVSLPDF